MNKYFVSILAIIFSLTAFTVLIGCKQEEVVKSDKNETIRPVKTMQVKSSTGVINRKFPGTVRASKRAELSFDIPGRIIVLNAKEGKKINKGDIIAQLDDRDFKHNYQSARANLKEAKLTFQRYRNLIKEKAVSKASLDRAEKAYDMAEANMKVAKKAFNDTKLKAYFSGTISTRHVENFQNIQAKQPIVSIEDRSTLEILVNVPEKELLKTDRDDLLSIHASFAVIPDKKFALDFKEISEKADPATRTYTVVFTMPAPGKYNILSGMTANVDIQVNTSKNTEKQTTPAPRATIVPAAAVMGDKENNSCVWIYSAETGTVLRRKVIMGQMTGVNIYILSGLEPGETIVTAGVNYLVEGMKVRPLTGKIGE